MYFQFNIDDDKTVVTVACFTKNRKVYIIREALVNAPHYPIKDQIENLRKRLKNYVECLKS